MHNLAVFTINGCKTCLLRLTGDQSSCQRVTRAGAACCSYGCSAEAPTHTRQRLQGSFRLGSASAQGELQLAVARIAGHAGDVIRHRIRGDSPSAWRRRSRAASPYSVTWQHPGWQRPGACATRLEPCPVRHPCVVGCTPCIASTHARCTLMNALTVPSTAGLWKLLTTSRDFQCARSCTKKFWDLLTMP